MSKVVLVNLNQNPETRIPDWFIDKIESDFSHIDLCILSAPHELRAGLNDVDYVLGWPFPKTFIKRNTNIKEIFFFSSQVPESFINQDFKLHNITGLNASYVVEYIENVLAALDPSKKILIMGLGEIGKLLKERLNGIPVKCLSRTPKDVNEYDYSHSTELIKEADIIIPTVTLNQETKKIFEKDNFFDHLKEDVFLLNTARGELFNEDNLINFFSVHPQAFYHTDVTVPEPYPEDGKLRELKNVTITNHIAGFGEGIWEKIYQKTKSIVSNWT